MRQTDYRCRLLYAIAAVMVVCGHAGGGGLSLMSDWFPYYETHLSLFVFCSGYLYREEDEERIGAWFLKKLRRLILPLYLYNLAYGLLVQLLRLFGFTIGGDLTLYNLLLMPLTDGHVFQFNMGGWFVFPLFLLQCLHLLTRRALNGKRQRVPEWVWFLLWTALGIGGNALACAGYRTGPWLIVVRTLHFLPCYALGRFYRTTLERYDKKIPPVGYFAAVFALQLVLICICGRVPSYTPSWCRNFYEGPVMPVLAAWLGVAFWVRIASLLEPTLAHSRAVERVAGSTYSIMMNQFTGFLLLKSVYALLSRTTGLFPDFDFAKYKSDIWWNYTPGGIRQTLLLYVAAGILFPLLVRRGIDAVKNALRRRRA